MLLNADKLVDALDLARNSGYEITLLSDFDMDGIMAGVLWFYTQPSNLLLRLPSGVPVGI